MCRERTKIFEKFSQSQKRGNQNTFLVRLSLNEKKLKCKLKRLQILLITTIDYGCIVEIEFLVIFDHDDQRPTSQLNDLMAPP